jgi:hypothetical protein
MAQQQTGRNIMLGRMTCLLFAVFVFCSAAIASEKVNPCQNGPFSKKLLVISVKSDPSMGAILQNTCIRKIGSQEFLVGEAADIKQAGEWRKGKTVWISLDGLIQVVEFNSVEELLAARPAKSECKQ